MLENKFVIFKRTSSTPASMYGIVHGSYVSQEPRNYDAGLSLFARIILLVEFRNFSYGELIEVPIENIKSVFDTETDCKDSL